ncbi:MAG TPA: glycine zipper 2TM domain-containing protein [Xylella sp.]
MNMRVLSFALIAIVMVAGCNTTRLGYGAGSGSGYNQKRCIDCGVVTRINVVPSNRTAPTGVSAIIGGVVGAVAGRQISKKTGGSKGNQNLSTLAGVTAGALAGNAIQDNVTRDSYDIQVRMDDGRVIVVNQADLGGITEKAYVRLVNGRVVLR